MPLPGVALPRVLLVPERPGGELLALPVQPATGGEPVEPSGLDPAAPGPRPAGQTAAEPVDGLDLALLIQQESF
ncbi:MAG: hypothetical protein JWN88_2884, partial [Frankiales bacterium]|nr:hypothetical protein [Frankiales bacterium]